MMIEGKRFAASRGFDLGNDTVELERNCFRLPLCIDRSPRGPLRHIAASLPDQPLPLAADMQHREIACAERRAFDWKAAALEMGEPVCHWAIIAKSDQGQHLERPFSRGSCRSRITHERAESAPS